MKLPDTSCLIEASAGTGKTHQLTNRIISLLARGEKVESILATTFTRKAAGEIRARVLFRLALASTDTRQSQLLSEQIQISNVDFSSLLKKVTEHQDRLNIGTIDGFFVHIATLFSTELGLPAHWSIIDSAKESQIRVEAVAEIIRTIQEEKQDVERATFLEMLNSKSANRSIQRELERLTAMLDRFYYDTQDADWAWAEPKGELDEKKLDTLLNRLLALEAPKNKDGTTPNSTWKTALEKCIGFLIERDWLNLLQHSLLQKIDDGESQYARKEITDEFVSVFRPLIEHCKYNILNDHRQKTLATRHLLELFNRALEQNRRANSWMRFSDITHALEHSASKTLEAELYFRLDNTIRHVLLDEFQDTSISQWNVLRPIIEEIIEEQSSGRSVLFVGDAKQAIYGWRGGVAGIFKHVAQSYPALNVLPLHESRRLRAAPASLVNDAFKGIVDNRSLKSFSKARAHWSSIYAEHTAFNTDFEGYCRLSVFKESEESNIDQIARLTLELHATYPDLEIAVLTRSSEPVKLICDSIRELNPSVVPSQEVGSNLYRSEPVRLICSLLRIAEQPGDTLSTFHISNSVLASKDVLSTELVSSRLFEMGLARFVQHYAIKLFPHCASQDQTRLERVIELAFEFAAKPYSRISDFVYLVKNTKTDSPFSSLVRVMNTHQSKGLEFDLVVLGDLDRDFFKSTDSILTDRTNELSKAEVATCYPNKLVRKSDAAMQKIFKANREQTVIEELSVLYVAMTRAKYGVYGMMKPPRKSTEGCTHGEVLCAALSQDQPQTGDTIYEIGNETYPESD